MWSVVGGTVGTRYQGTVTLVLIALADSRRIRYPALAITCKMKTYIRRKSEILGIESLASDTSTKRIEDQTRLRHTCALCRESFPSEDLLLSHLAAHSGPELPVPVTGPTASASRQAALKQQHPCDFCSSSFSTFTRLKEHAVSVHGETKPLKCLTCGTRFRDRIVLRVHEEAKHSNKRQPCDICGKSFSAERQDSYRFIL